MTCIIDRLLRIVNAQSIFEKMSKYQICIKFKNKMRYLYEICIVSPESGEDCSI